MIMGGFNSSDIGIHGTGNYDIATDRISTSKELAATQIGDHLQNNDERSACLAIQLFWKGLLRRFRLVIFLWGIRPEVPQPL